ncbi:hypothetical protein GP486_004083 [Trichoglossum hirsutum]|uniref:Uncharacterized protein n=1 Tax=Trichoglossum hirsutum TaxID=265104 RepID=A0A9P8LBW3_9PEZI|nr:hypothetical protein GP486_004083 [Trichoglossum hirsutum]
MEQPNSDTIDKAIADISQRISLLKDKYAIGRNAPIMGKFQTPQKQQQQFHQQLQQHQKQTTQQQTLKQHHELQRQMLLQHHELQRHQQQTAHQHQQLQQQMLKQYNQLQQQMRHQYQQTVQTMPQLQSVLYQVEQLIQLRRHNLLDPDIR